MDIYGGRICRIRRRVLENSDKMAADNYPIFSIHIPEDLHAPGVLSLIEMNNVQNSVRDSVFLLVRGT